MKLVPAKPPVAFVYVDSEDRWEEASTRALSAREVEVLMCIGSGMTCRDSAKQMRVSWSSFNMYRNRLLDKLGLESPAAIVAYAVHYGFVKPDTGFNPRRGRKPFAVRAGKESPPAVSGKHGES